MLGKNFLGKTEFGQKIWIRLFFCLKKQVGLTQGGGYMTPPPENSRVKIVLDCYKFSLVRSPTKFQTPRIIISCRSRVPVVGGVGWVPGV